MAAPQFEAPKPVTGEPPMMSVLREDYIETGTLDQLHAAAAAHGNDAFSAPIEGNHSWVNFVVSTYGDDSAYVNDAFDVLIENGVRFNSDFRTADGQNEMMLVADTFGYGGLAKALKAGMDPMQGWDIDNKGRTGWAMVQIAAGHKGTELVEAYALHQSHQRISTMLAGTFATVSGAAATYFGDAALGIITAVVVGGATKGGGDVLADNRLDDQITRIGRAGHLNQEL
jgi:hypothetical protein